MKKLLVLLSLILLFLTPTIAEEGWILCQPDSYVNIRLNPRTNSEVTGQLYAGDLVSFEGKTRNGFVHCTGLSTEYGEGWVYKGFICPSEPVQDGHVYRIEANGRVACRRSIGGQRRCWLYNGDILTVYMKSDEWCLTNRGFVGTEFIDLTAAVDIEYGMSADDMTWEE